MRARLSVLAATLALCAHVVVGASPPRTAMAPVDPALAQALQNILDTQRADQGVAGFSAAVWTADDALWLGVSGVSTPGEPLHTDMVFGIGSITKTWTAAAILQLSDEGHLGLDDSLGTHFPSRPNISGAITIRQLLTHTSGIYNYTMYPSLFSDVFADPTRRWAPAEILDRFVLTPSFDAGSRWGYSNTNYIVLGMIVEALTGSTLSDVLRQRFHEPLALDRTFLEGSEVSSDAWADAWSDLDRDGTLENIGSVPRTSLYSVAWGAGALGSTAQDTARWIHALFSGDVLPETLRAQMTTAEPHSLSAGLGYGLGAARFVLDDEELWGHAGGIPGFVSVAMYSETLDAVIVVLANQDNARILQVGAALFRTVRDHPSTGQSVTSWGAVKRRYR